MKFRFVSKRERSLPFLRRSEENLLQVTLCNMFFHGQIVYGQGRYGGLRSDPNTQTAPIHLARNAFQFPAIFVPDLHWCFSDHVRDLLREYPSLTFQPVVFERLCCIKIHVREADRLEIFAQDHIDLSSSVQLFEQLPHDPTLCEKVGTYHEFRGPIDNRAEYQELFDRYPEAIRYRIDAEPHLRDEFAGIRVSPRLLEDYPMIGSFYGLAMAEEVYRKLEPYLDPDFFLVEEGTC